MSNLWSGQPTSIRLDDLEVICTVLGCGPDELLIPEPGKVHRHAESTAEEPSAVAGEGTAVRPRRRGGRSLPPR
jgi:hypothetical protein